MSTGFLCALVVKCGDRIFGIVPEKASGLLRLHFLVGHGVERRKLERVSLEPESSSEFVELVEEDRRHSSAPKSDAPKAFFRPTPPALMENSLSDHNSNDVALGHVGLRFPAGTFILDIYGGASLALFSEVRWHRACFFCRWVGLFYSFVRPKLMRSCMIQVASIKNLKLSYPPASLLDLPLNC